MAQNQEDFITNQRVKLNLDKIQEAMDKAGVKSARLAFHSFSIQAQKEGWDLGTIDKVVKKCDGNINMLAQYCYN